MRFDILKAYLKYKLGFTVGLPAFSIRAVKECENGEPMIDIKKSGIKLFFGGRLDKDEKVFLRKSVADKIVSAAKLLPNGTCFIIYDAHRPLKYQQQSWERAYKYYKSLYPNETDEQITLRTRRVIADPRHGHGGHQTGGAIDIGLCDENGTELDMGTPYNSVDRNIRTNANVNKTAQDNRKLLCKIMKRQKFVNYPNEWWHFCYGDQMWAAYSGKKTCPYGMVE